MALHRRLFFLLLILLPTQLGFHFWPEWSYVLGRKIDYLSPTVYLTDILIVLLLLTWAMENVSRITYSVLGIIRNTKYVIPFVLFAFLNAWFAASPWVAVYKWLKVFEFVGLGWYIVKNRYRISEIRHPIMIGVLYSSVIALVQFAIQRSVGGPLWFLGERTFDITTPGIARWEGFGRLLLRPYATFPHPNVLGGYLAVFLPVIIQYANKPINQYFNKIRYIFVMTVVLGVISLVLSFSRSAWIACLVGVGLINRKLLLPALFVVVLILLRVNVYEESLTVRNNLNTAAISMWKQSPLVGVGLGNFVVELPKQSIHRQGNFLQPAHNIYLLVLSETGVVGAVLFLWVLMRGARGAKGHLGKMLMTLFIIGLVDHYPLTLQQGQILLTLVLGLSMVK